jgi:hypothetical protein
MLADGVCGYRRGAEPGSTYSADYQRFLREAEHLASDARWVVFADIEQFFPSISFPRMLALCGEVLDRGATEDLAALFADLRTVGIDSLPAGYADARMLANLYLHHIDVALDVPFVRWVDDYRLFVPPGRSPDEVIEALRVALARMELVLNITKTRVVDVGSAAHEHRNTLASAYHPERDSPDRVRENLHRLFQTASASPIEERRTLRFVIARLARERDPAAIDFVVGHLLVLPWEAPRFSAYLLAVCDEPGVAPAVDRLLVGAIERKSDWLVTRLAALACHVGCSAATAKLVSDELAHFAGTPAWGMGLRLLALTGSTDVYRHVARHWSADPRAAVVAITNLDRAPSGPLAASAPVITSAAEQHGPMPLPMVDSIL